MKPSTGAEARICRAANAALKRRSSTALYASAKLCDVELGGYLESGSDVEERPFQGRVSESEMRRL